VCECTVGVDVGMEPPNIVMGYGMCALALFAVCTGIECWEQANDECLLWHERMPKTKEQQYYHFLIMKHFIIFL
jgi:hypothetical protein